MRFLVAVFLFFPLIVGAQSVVISGKCTDKRNKGIEHAHVFMAEDTTISTYTNSLGFFTLSCGSLQTLTIQAEFGDYKEIRTIEVQGRTSIVLDDIRFSFIEEKDVKVTGARNPFELPKHPIIDLQLSPLSGVERTLVYTTAATSNNELTTNYNVRGGSYDENLVYVNGFNIFRPFLTRSGQQEGMSFINSALVGAIRFSAGGFDAQYGDKLSSVLDITYKRPDSFKASVMASLLGVEVHSEGNPSGRFNYLVGARYRSNGYLLNSLPTKGAYNPVFWDAQFLTNYALTENLTWSVLGHFSSNNFRFTPQTQETDFGTANEAYSFRIYFDGQEQTRFQTMMGGTSLNWTPNKKTKLDLYATVFNSVEREYFDIQGQYYINLLETDPSKEEYGDSIAVLGIGTFLNHARNKLNATILNVYHNGESTLYQGYKDDERNKFRNHKLLWGFNVQHDDFVDVLSEWKMIDSAGYSVPQGTDEEVELFETIKGNLALKGQRYSGFMQLNALWSNTKRNLSVTKTIKRKENGVKITESYQDTIMQSNAKWALSVGNRIGYTSVNRELYITPRVALTYFPRMYLVDNGKIKRRDVSFRFASGLYYQPPFYREFRTFNGALNLDVKSQKSFHAVIGSDVYFNMWNRDVPFKLTAEAYYKYLWDVNPYEIENVRTRYYAENNAIAYAYGVDMNIHGQFVEGIESFFKVGLLSTKEDILNDSYTEYYNQAGERIIFGYSEDQTVVDSAQIFPGYVPRPTDQWINFGALIQDRMPNFESFSVQMGLLYGARLPYGPPDFSRYKDTLRMKAYFRVDIGMSYDFLYKKKEESTFWNRNFTDAILSFEVFNLLGVNNVLSKQWIQDIEGKYYSIPNYLTQRRFNLKLILRF
jgi:hypothetical protein